MVRTALQALGVGSRKTFYGMFADQWRSKGFRDHINRMFLLVDVRDNGQHPITDHLWFWESKAFKQLELKKGDVIKFRATVSKYRKRVRSDYDIEDERYTVEDYKLTYPKDVEKIADPKKPMLDASQMTLEALI